MEKFLKIVGVIVVVWIGLSLVGWIFGFLFKALFWVLVIGGAVAVGAYLGTRKNAQIRS